MTDEQHARERRQLLLMRERLVAFTARALSLSFLINDLEALVWELELASDDWKDAFLLECGELEIAYAVALDRGEAIPDMTHPGVGAAVRSLQRMVTQSL